MFSTPDPSAMGLHVLWAFLGGIVFCSFGEYLIHRHLMHRRRLPLWCYRAAPDLRVQFNNHAVLHHGTYYKQFDHEPSAEGKYFNLRILAPDTLRVIGLLSLPLLALGIWVSPAAMVTLVAMIVGQNLLWNRMHVQMHVPETGRWFRHTAYFRFAARHHFMHHRCANRNYNVVLPLADVVLRTVARPRLRDVREMLRLGYLKPRSLAGRRLVERNRRPGLARSPRLARSASSERR